MIIIVADLHKNKNRRANLHGVPFFVLGPVDFVNWHLQPVLRCPLICVRISPRGHSTDDVNSPQVYLQVIGTGVRSWSPGPFTIQASLVWFVSSLPARSSPQVIWEGGTVRRSYWSVCATCTGEKKPDNGEEDWDWGLTISSCTVL